MTIKSMGKILTLSVLALGFTVLLFAQTPNASGDFYLDPGTGLKIYAPLGWQRRDIPEQMNQTKVIWYKTYPQGKAYLMLKMMQVSPE